MRGLTPFTPGLPVDILKFQLFRIPISAALKCNADTSNQLEINMIASSSRKTVLGLPLAALALAVSSAYAAPVVGPADDSFFTYPSQAVVEPGKPGDLISYRPATVVLNKDAPAANAWNVIYKSRNSFDDQNFAFSGTVLTPKAAWAGTGPRPVVLYAVGTHGLASKCAPSKQLAKGVDYEASNIAAALKAGYSVLITDYQGALDGENSIPSSYLAGRSQARALLDIFRAATAIPGAGIGSDSPVGIWGYSQGGQTAAWAGELAPSYAPEIKLTGVAAGGIPGDFIRTANYLNDSIGFAFLGAGIVGLSTEYGDAIPINLIASQTGQAALDKIATQCVFEALFEFQNRDIAEFTLDNQPLSNLVKVPSVRQTLNDQNLGRNKINVPLYQYHGKADEFIPLDQAVALKKAYCAKGTNVTYDVYPSEHIVTQFQGAPASLAFLADRFAGKPATSTCGTTAPDPTSTANPGGGDFVVTLDKWPLKAKVGLKLLNQTILLPDTSTFSANANVTAKTLDGNLSIPEFKQTIKIVGIPFPVGIRVTPVGKVAGSVNVDNDGILRIKAKAPVNITVTSVLGIPFGECKTTTPVEFPISFDGPVSSLGDGTLNFNGAVTFPQIKGCFISGILTGFMSGPGQTYDFTVVPPAPVKF